MGTYTKPEIIKNDPFSAAREGLNRGAKQLATNVANTKKANATAAAAAAKAAAEKLKREQRQNKDAEKLRSGLNSLDQPKIKAFPDKFKGFTNGLIDELMTLPYESNAWNEMVGRIESYTDLSNNAMQLLEREVASFKNSYSMPQGSGNGLVTSSPLKSGVSGARIKSNDSAENDWWILMDTFVNKKGAGIEFSTGDKGGAVGLTMQHPDNEQIDNTKNPPVTYYLQPGDKDYKENITLNFAQYQDKTSKGYDLINVTSREDFNKGAKDAFALTGGKAAYRDLKEKAERIFTQNGKINTETIISYEQSNERIKDKIVNDLDTFLPDNRNARQNMWQMLAGESRNTTTSLPFAQQEDWSIFDENNQGMRIAYAELLADKVIADNAKDDKIINKIKNVKAGDKQKRLDNYRNDGLNMSFNDLGEKGNELTKSIMTDINGVKTPLFEVIKGGKMKPNQIHELVEGIITQKDDQGDAYIAADVLMPILQSSSTASGTGKTYEIGRDLRERVVEEYKILAQIATDQMNPGQMSDDDIIAFAAGKLSQKPGDRATWTANGQASSQTIMPQKTGMDQISGDDLWETSGARARKIVDSKNYDAQALEKLIYKNLDFLSNKERDDLMTGANIGGSGNANNGGGTKENNLGTPYATKDKAIKAANGKKVVNVDGKYYITK